MDLTAELRWFLPGPPPEAARAWFDDLDGTPHPQRPRIDTYLRPTDPALGVKLRQGRLELKRRTANGGEVSLHPLVEGRVEVWAKWSFGVAEPEDVGEGWVEVTKRRRMRIYSVDGATVRPADGASAPAFCSVELTAVEANGVAWWTVCFEAHTDGSPGAGPAEAALRRAAAHVLAEASPPHLSASASYSYPDWLLSHAP